MRNRPIAVSFALVTLVAVLLSGCARNSTHQSATSGCLGTATRAECLPPELGDPGSDVSAFGPISAAPEVRAAEARSSAAAREIERVLAANRPDLVFQTGLGAQTGGMGYGGQSASSDYSYALSLNVPIYRSGADAAADTARAEYRVASANAGDRRVATAYEIAISLLTIRQQQEVIAALDNYQNAVASLRRGVEDEIAVSAASRLDLDEIDRQLSRNAMSVVAAKLVLNEASTTVKRYGVSASSRLPDVSGLGLDKNQQALIDIALRNNPRVQSRTAAVDAASSRVREADGLMGPSVSAQLQLYGETTSLSEAGLANGARAQVQFSMPFDFSGVGGATKNQRSDEMLAAQYDSEAAKAGVATAVRIAFDRREQARRMQALAQAELDSAQTFVVGIQAERKVGGRTLMDEVRALENLGAARVSLINARFERLAAEYTLAAETGLITSLFGSSIPTAALNLK
ncbi:TolC family protein [Devosia faecipullorum]|uniref:TolC family protein n=1 Tax=Devosia faecipullorum TaxID=2755039 RepID=UPI00187B539B|nr:TolC family protein [Devosia faecipullorum]MBE7732884.1 TolC family protein [Devosia faecipullorum]